MIRRSLFFVVVFLVSLVVISIMPPNLTGLVTTEKPLGVSAEVGSPLDRISEEQIEIQADRIIIHINNSQISRYANTNSMDPLLDEKANGIEIIPESEEDIQIGDIVTYEQNGLLVVHRVMETGYDEQGRYYMVKGDNNEGIDAKIRFEQIKYITIGILY